MPRLAAKVVRGKGRHANNIAVQLGNDGFQHRVIAGQFFGQARVV